MTLIVHKIVKRSIDKDAANLLSNSIFETVAFGHVVLPSHMPSERLIFALLSRMRSEHCTSMCGQNDL